MAAVGQKTGPVSLVMTLKSCHHYFCILYACTKMFIIMCSGRPARCAVESEDERLPAEHEGIDGVPQGKGRSETHQGMFSTHINKAPYDGVHRYR